MEFIWALYVCGGLTGWGCGNVSLAAMPDFETCETARLGVVFGQTVGSQSSGEDGNSGYAICKVFSVDDYNMDMAYPPAWAFK